MRRNGSLPTDALRDVPYEYRNLIGIIAQVQDDSLELAKPPLSHQNNNSFHRHEKEVPVIELNVETAKCIQNSIDKNLRKYKKNRKVASLLWEQIYDASLVTGSEPPSTGSTNKLPLISPRSEKASAMVASAAASQKEVWIKEVDETWQHHFRSPKVTHQIRILNDPLTNSAVAATSAEKGNSKVSNDEFERLQLPYIVIAHKKLSSKTAKTGCCISSK